MLGLSDISVTGPVYPRVNCTVDETVTACVTVGKTHLGQIQPASETGPEKSRLFVTMTPPPLHVHWPPPCLHGDRASGPAPRQKILKLRPQHGPRKPGHVHLKTKPELDRG